MHLPLHLTATGFALKPDNPLPVLSPRFLCSVTVVMRVTAGVPLSELTLPSLSLGVSSHTAEPLAVPVFRMPCPFPQGARSNPLSQSQPCKCTRDASLRLSGILMQQFE